MFVKPMMGQRFMVYTDDDVAQRYGTEATITWQHQKASSDAAASDLNRTVDNSAFRAEGIRNERKQQAHECGRQRPSVSSNDKNAGDDRTHLRP
jgi:hypothetical protein